VLSDTVKPALHSFVKPNSKCDYIYDRRARTLGRSRLQIKLYSVSRHRCCVTAQCTSFERSPRGVKKISDFTRETFVYETIPVGNSFIRTLSQAYAQRIQCKREINSHFNVLFGSPNRILFDPRPQLVHTQAVLNSMKMFYNQSIIV